MAKRALLLSFFGPVTVLPAVVLGVLAGAVAHAEDEALPPRTQWRASSSSGAQPTMEPAFAIDGDASTKWGGAFSPGHWLQVDLSRTAAIGGALIHWDSAFAAAYLILSSEDGQHWQTAYETTDSQGRMDYVFFPAVHARYLRLASAPRTSDWGVSVFEFEPLAVSESPRITGLVKGDHPAALWSAQATLKIVDTGPGGWRRPANQRAADCVRHPVDVGTTGRDGNARPLRDGLAKQHATGGRLARSPTSGGGHCRRAGTRRLQR